jgi:5-methylcytosine-specific restriction endonuclease McrA
MIDTRQLAFPKPSSQKRRPTLGLKVYANGRETEVLAAFPKPNDMEGKVTLTPDERRLRKLELLNVQHMKCATCGTRLTLKPGFFNSAELDHIKPQPAGCAKDDRDENLQVLCWKCNAEKSSKRNNVVGKL